MSVMLFLLSCLLLLGGGTHVSPTKSELCQTMPARIEGKSFCLIRENGEPEEVFLNGVNMGAASAGNYPGEFAIDKETYRYEKMYVIRPQFFIPIITLLRNAALNSLKYRQELEVVKNQQLDLLHFEENMNAFKTGFARNYELASRLSLIHI